MSGRFRTGTTDHDGDGRMGGSMKETDMPKERDALEQQAFTQGREARANAIDRRAPPHGKDSKLLKPWQDGWDYEDGLRNAPAVTSKAAKK